MSQISTPNCAGLWTATIENCSQRSHSNVPSCQADLRTTASQDLPLYFSGEAVLAATRPKLLSCARLALSAMRD